MNTNNNEIFLYGDDFDQAQIEKWFKEEEEGYASLGSEDRSNYKYEYHSENIFYGYRNLNLKEGSSVLSIGGAYGDELLPVIDKLSEIIILEPSEKLRQSVLKGKPVRYMKPNVSGRIDLPDQSVDLITCFGVLHHIPNVSYVISEMNRILKDGGVLLIKEPIVSMGDWNQPRKGLTKNERGIPIQFFRRVIENQNLRIRKEYIFKFRPYELLIRKTFLKRFYETKLYFFFDLFFARLFMLNYTYAAKNKFKQLRPVAVFYILEK